MDRQIDMELQEDAERLEPWGEEAGQRRRKGSSGHRETREQLRFSGDSQASASAGLISPTTLFIAPCLSPVSLLHQGQLLLPPENPCDGSSSTPGPQTETLLPTALSGGGGGVVGVRACVHICLWGGSF